MDFFLFIFIIVENTTSFRVNLLKNTPTERDKKLACKALLVRAFTAFHHGILTCHIFSHFPL